jgi:predicted ATPase
MCTTSCLQVDCGGKGVLSDPSQTNMIAALNLKAGKRAITYSDFNVAHKLFQHGISFLESDHWQSQYFLSIDLFNSAADAGK